MSEEYVIIDKTELKTIANTVRSITGTDDAILASELDTIVVNTSSEYATKEELNQLSQEIDNLVAQGIQQVPLFANNIEECTDTSKVYVLPDGYIYGYVFSEGSGTTPNFINQLPISKATDGSVYDGKGYKNDTRLNSSKSEATLSGASLSGYIPVSNGDVVRIAKGLVKTDSTNPSNGSCNVVLYNSSFSPLSAETVYQFGAGTTGLGFENIVVDSDKYLTQFTINSENAKYLRITFTTHITDVNTQIVTVNQEIAYTTNEGGYAWVNTNHAFIPNDYDEEFVALNNDIEKLNVSKANHEERLGILEQYSNESTNIPTYWLEELKTKADSIQIAMENAGRNKSSFLWYTDAHWINNAKVSPLLLNYLIKNTQINKINFGGDIVGDPSTLTHNDIKNVYEWRKLVSDLPNHHSVIGNHDNLHKGRNDNDVANLVYSFLLAQEESTDMVIGGDLYYYIDNPCEKTRYLYLDSGRFSISDDETKFIIDSLGSVPNGWHVVAISHIWFIYTNVTNPTVGTIPTYAQKVLDLFDSYNARQSGTVTMVSASNSYNFTNCGGKIEFCIGGHIHVDHKVTSTNGIPVILTASDTNQERSGNEEEDCGTLGTITESAVYGIVADYNNKQLHVIGVGRGGSRIITLT